MKIHGLQKMTLLDYPGKVACTVFLGGCDFRCPFCHNADLLDMNAPALMDDEELLKFLKTRTSLLEGVAFTGGEPLLRKDLPELLTKIKDMGFPVKLDSNGNHPEALIKVVEEGLVDYVAMDVKHCPKKYGEIIGIENFDTGKISTSIDFLRAFNAAPTVASAPSGVAVMCDEGPVASAPSGVAANAAVKNECHAAPAAKAGFTYEFRTTAVREFHDEEAFEKIGEWIKGAENYYIQNFVDRESVMYGGLHGFEKEELEKFKKIAEAYVARCEVRGE